MTPRRVPELDSLRGLAAVAVVLFHYTYPGPAFDRVFYLGALSLELFFVLSGFLITSIVIENAGGEGFLRNFYVRRGLRLYPIYYLLLLGLAAAHRFRPGAYSLEGLPYYLTYTQHLPRYWFGPDPPAIYPLSHTWSLAVEEQYYILWPLLVCLLGRRAVVPLALAFVATAVGARAYGFSPQILVGRCDGLALGGLLAAALSVADRARVRGRSGAYGPAFALAGFAALNYLTWGQALLGARPFSLGEASPALDYLAAGAFFFAAIGLVVTHSGRPALAPLRAGPLRALGTVSYGIYLYHLPVLVFLDRPVLALGVRDRWAAVGVKLAACLAVSAASWALVERPILSAKGRFPYGAPAPPEPRPREDRRPPRARPGVRRPRPRRGRVVRRKRGR